MIALGALGNGEQLDRIKEEVKRNLRDNFESQEEQKQARLISLA